jgi:choline dehydrogenase
VIDSRGNGLNGRKLKILTNARALRFNTEQDRAISVDYVRTFGSHANVHTACLKYKGKLILSAGALQTPKLLMLSGVGPAAELTALGLKVVLDSPNVGQNLQNQYGAFAEIAVPGALSQAEAWIDGSPYTAPTGQRLVQLLMEGAAGPGPGAYPILASLVNAKSRGSVYLVSADPLIDPVINMNMYSDGSFSTNGTDANLVVSSLKIIRDAAALTGYTMLNPSPAVYAGGDAALFAYATSASAWAIQDHITGTTRMGTDITNSVVDGRLRVHGLKNVHIGDIGVEPDNTNGNTCSGAYYIALELANILGYPTPPAL